MKVLGIVGSPRKNGNSDMLAAHCLKAVAEEGLDTEIIQLAGLDIRPCNACNACMVCSKEELCPIDDDLFPIYLRMKEADGIILATPVYFGSATGLAKAFMERAGYISRHNGNPFSGKVGGGLVVARRAGHNFTLAELTLWFQILGLVIPGSTYWNIAFGREKGQVPADEEGMHTAWNFGQNVARTLQKLSG